MNERFVAGDTDQRDFGDETDQHGFDLPDAPVAAKAELVDERIAQVEKKRPRLIAELDEKIAKLDQATGAAVNALDEDIRSIMQILVAALTVQGQLVDAVRELTNNPHDPTYAAAKAREIMEEAHGKGPEDDGVVQESAGDKTGDA